MMPDGETVRSVTSLTYAPRGPEGRGLIGPGIAFVRGGCRRPPLVWPGVRIPGERMQSGTGRVTAMGDSAVGEHEPANGASEAKETKGAAGGGGEDGTARPESVKRAAVKRAAPEKASAKKPLAKKPPPKKKQAGMTAATKAPAKQPVKQARAKPESRLAMIRRARRINRELGEVYYYAHPELDFENPFQLLVATVLSAQTTDLRVNQTTPAVFAAYPTPEDMAAADPEKMEELLRPTGFFRAKTKSVLGLSAALRDRFDGKVPGNIKDLVSLPGVGRKTAFVVLGNAFGVPGLTVDTHFGRLVRRWKLTEQTDADKVEAEIAEIIPKSEWTMFSHRTIFHGRRICHSRKPACGACPITQLCPSYGEGELDPEKAKKLLKYEMGGQPGQRLKPPSDYPGQPAPPLGRNGAAA
jgi:endonuclease III